MPILIRTPSGDDALRSPLTELPSRTKALLMAVDGKTDSSVYLASLSSFSDLPALLGTLVRAGLVRAMAPRGTQPEPPGAVPSHENTWFCTTVQQAGDFADWSAASAVPLQAGAPIQDDPWETHGLLPELAAQAAALDSIEQQQVRRAVLLMNRFVATHFADQAVELLPVIEKLSSVERIARSLKKYEALVAPAGKAAVRHLLDLRATLTSR